MQKFKPENISLSSSILSNSLITFPHPSSIFFSFSILFFGKNLLGSQAHRFTLPFILRGGRKKGILMVKLGRVFLSLLCGQSVEPTPFGIVISLDFFHDMTFSFESLEIEKGQ